MQISTPPMSANLERKLRYPPILYTITCYFSLALRCYVPVPVVVCLWCGGAGRGGADRPFAPLSLRRLDSPLPGLPTPFVRTYVC